MKQFLTLLCFFAYLTGFSQRNWNFVLDKQDLNISGFTDMAPLGDTAFVVSAQVSQATCPYLMLYAFNLRGGKLWEQSGNMAVITTKNGSIITSGYTPLGCVEDAEKLVIAKYNNFGEEIFSKNYNQNFYSENELQPQDIVVSTDGIIAVCTPNRIVLANEEGNVLSIFKSSDQGILKGLEFIGSSEVIIHSEHYLYKTDILGQTSDSISFNAKLMNVQYRNDSLYCLTPKYICRLPLTLANMDTIWSSASTEAIEFKFHDNELWLLGCRNDSIAVFPVNNSRQGIYRKKQFEVHDFLLLEKQLILAGQSFSGQAGFMSIDYKEQPSEVAISDIRLLDVKISDFEGEYVTMPEQEPIYRGYRFMPEFILKNDGDKDVLSFAVFAQLHGGMNCAGNFFYHKFDNVVLHPGETISVTPPSTLFEEFYNKEICFKVMAPNSTIEANTTQNEFCKTIEGTGILDVLSQYDMKVYPNPCKNTICIRTSSTIYKHVLLLDMHGQVCLETFKKNKVFELDVSSLPEGVYFMKIVSGKEIKTEKMIRVK